MQAAWDELQDIRKKTIDRTQARATQTREPVPGRFSIW